MTRSPPITAHLVLGEGGWELQAPGRYPGRGGRGLAWEPPRPVARKLGQTAEGGGQDDGVEDESGAWAEQSVEYCPQTAMGTLNE